MAGRGADVLYTSGPWFSIPGGRTLTFLSDPELVEGEVRNDNVLPESHREPRYE